MISTQPILRRRAMADEPRSASPSAERAPLQFRIRSLLILTTVVAVLMSFIVAPAESITVLVAIVVPLVALYGLFHWSVEMFSWFDLRRPREEIEMRPIRGAVARPPEKRAAQP